MNAIYSKTFILGILIWLVMIVQGHGGEQIVITTGPSDNPTIMRAKLIIREMYSRLGKTIRIKYFPFARAIVTSNSGEADAELLRKAGIQKKFPNLMMVSVPIGYVEWVVFTKNKDLSVSGWESLKPYSIDYVRGVKYIEDNTKGMKVHAVATTEQAFKKLEIGRTDVVIVELFSGKKVLNELKLNNIRIFDPPISRIPFYHYVNTRHAALVPKMEEILKQLEKEGFMKAVKEKVIKQLFK